MGARACRLRTIETTISAPLTCAVPVDRSSLGGRRGRRGRPGDSRRAQSIGWEHVADTNAYDSERIGFSPSTIRHGGATTALQRLRSPDSQAPQPHRGHAYQGQPARVRRRPRGRGVGLEGGQPVEYRARKEVIVSAGTIESPLLLERSGIGNPDVLRRAGIDVGSKAQRRGARHRAARRGDPGPLKRNIGQTQQLNTLPKQAWQG